MLVCVAGPTTYFPSVNLSKKQGCVSTSMRESEIAAMSVGLRKALNVMDLWEVVSNKFAKKKSPRPGGPKSNRIGAQAPTIGVEREVPLLVYEDNQATISASEKGTSKAVGHLQRTHRAKIHSLKS